MIDSRFRDLDNEKVRHQMKKLVAAFLGAAEESILAEQTRDNLPSKTTPKEQPAGVAKGIDI